MTVRLEGITVLAGDVAALTAFFRDALELRPAVVEEHYAAFEGDGVRFAVFSRQGMGANTHDHPDYRRPRSGQAFELNFECDDAAAVDGRLAHIRSLGGLVIAEPVRTDWGHYSAFFADPEGNIHSLFAVLRD
ncbi:VOC family protein [Microbacterium aurantiacum]|uniref:VOC family protein n=1 Tax=Microbacterium aurantiacum TaxID=162393 RepID=UPI000C8056E1|nr:VOC family protein [Microbacterium aurantiacum]